MDVTYNLNSLVSRLAEPGARTRDQVARLSEALASGRVDDAGKALRHDFSALSRAERDLALHDSLRHSVEAGRRLVGMAGTSADRIAIEIDALREAFKPSITGGAYPDVAIAARATEEGLRAILSALDVVVDGRSVFGGGRADAPAIDGAQAVMDDLAGLYVPGMNEADLRAAVADYFAAPVPPAAPAAGTFLGDRVPAGAPDAVSIRLGDEGATRWAVSVDDPAILSILSEVGQAYALGATPDLAETDATRDFYATAMPAKVATALDAAIDLRARIGTLESRLDAAADRLDADRFDALGRRDALIGADPYETATRLEAETARLETVYTLTARLSRLRLTDYL